MKPAALRPAAEDDLIEEAKHYAREGGIGLGERMFDAALEALRPIERTPGVGSIRMGQLCDIPGLRSWRVMASNRLPCAVVLLRVRRPS